VAANQTTTAKTAAWTTAAEKLGKLAEAAAILAATLAIALLARRLMRRSLEPRLPSRVYKPLENITFYGILGAGAAAALAPFGVSITSLLVAGGFAGIVVGLASQQAFSNIISGLFLLIEQPLRVGDPVQVGDVGGVVTDINIFSTRIRTWDGYIVRIPNSSLYTGNITNYARTSARRVEVQIGISYKSDIEKAIQAIIDYMNRHPYCLVNPAPEAFVTEYADSAIVITARCWAPSQVWFTTKTQITTGLKKALDQAGIEIPYPQLDLHIRDTTTIPVKLHQAGEQPTSSHQEDRQTG